MQFITQKIAYFCSSELVIKIHFNKLDTGDPKPLLRRAEKLNCCNST